MVPEAELEQTDAGLVPRGEGWFVLNAREARWRHREGRGDSLPFTGWTAHEAETLFHEEQTSDPGPAYARFAEPRPTRYRDGWLPGD